MDTVGGALTAQHLLAEAECQGESLLGDILHGIYVLEVAVGGTAGGQDALKESIHSPIAGSDIGGGDGGLQSGLLGSHAAVLGQEVEGAEDGAVTHGLTKGGNSGDDLLSRHLTEDRLAEVSGYGLHLGGNGGVIVGEVGVVTAGVDDAEVVAGGGHIKGQGLDDRGGGIGKVNSDDTAYGTGHLIHQTAGLAEELVFGELGDLGDRHLVHLAVVVQVGLNGTHHILKGGRGGQTRTLENAGHGAGIKTADGVAVVHKAAANACDEGGRGTKLGLVGLRIVCKGHYILVKALALEADDAVVAGRGYGQHVQADGGGDDTTVVVVGMVARKLASARHGKEGHLAVGAVHGGKGLNQRLGAGALNGSAAGTAQSVQSCVQLTGIQSGEEGGQRYERFIGNFDSRHGYIPFGM